MRLHSSSCYVDIEVKLAKGPYFKKIKGTFLPVFPLQSILVGFNLSFNNGTLFLS